MRYDANAPTPNSDGYDHANADVASGERGASWRCETSKGRRPHPFARWDLFSTKVLYGGDGRIEDADHLDLDSAPSPWFEEIHDRMPVMVGEEDGEKGSPAREDRPRRRNDP